MWVRKSLVVLVLLFLASCRSVSLEQDIDAAIDAGLLLPLREYRPATGSETVQLDLELVEVRRGPIYIDIEIPAEITGPVVLPLRFEESGGVFYMPVRRFAGTFVSEGTVLAEQTFSGLELLELEHRRLVFEITQHDERFTAERAALRDQIAEYRRNINSADETTGENEIELMRLRLSRLELQMERLLHTNEQTRQGLNDRRLEMETRLYGERIYAPFDGILTFVQPAYDGSTVSSGLVYFTIADVRHFEFTAMVIPGMVNYGNIHTMTGLNGRLSFDVQVVSDPFVLGDRPQSMYKNLRLVDETAFFSSLEDLDLSLTDLIDTQLRLIVNEVLIHDTLILPDGAIHRENAAEYVLIYEDGVLSRRFVTTGYEYRNQVQVLMGVYEGQKVVMR